MPTAIDDLSGRAVPWQGSAVLPSGAGNVYVNTAPLDLYVSDINGNDANSGLTPAKAVKTLAGALSKITFQVVAFDVIIHVGAHGGAGYTWAPLDGYMLIDGASIYVYGDGAGQPGEDGFIEVVASTAAGAGSSNKVVKSAALVADTYLGNVIQVLTGPAAGDLRTIKENTTTDILPATYFSGAFAVGNNYRIVRPAVKIVAPSFASSTLLLCSGLGLTVRPGSVYGSTTPVRSALVLANLAYELAAPGAAVYEMQNSVVQMFGVELGSGLINHSGELDWGVTTYQKAALSSLTTSDLQWHGWGVTRLGDDGLNGLYLLGDGATTRGVYVGSTLFHGSGDLEFYAGRLKVAGTDNGLYVGNNHGIAHCTLGTHGSTITQYLGVKISYVEGSAIRVAVNSTVECPSLGADAPLVLVSSGVSAGATEAVGIWVEANGVVSISWGHNFAGGFSLTTAGFGAYVWQQGKLYVDHDMYLYITATKGQFTLSGLVGDAYNFVGSPHPGFFLADASGAVIYAVD